MSDMAAFQDALADYYDSGAIGEPPKRDLPPPHGNWEWLQDRGAICVDCSNRWPCEGYAEITTAAPDLLNSTRPTKAER